MLKIQYKSILTMILLIVGVILITNDDFALSGNGIILMSKLNFILILSGVSLILAIILIVKYTIAKRESKKSSAIKRGL